MNIGLAAAYMVCRACSSNLFIEIKEFHSFA